MSSSDRHLLLRDVRTIELALEGHALRTGVRAVPRFRDAVAARDDVHDPTAAHDDIASRVAFRRAMEREHVLGRAVETQDGHTRLRRPRLALGAEHRVDGGALAKADRLRGEASREPA